MKTEERRHEMEDYGKFNEMTLGQLQALKASGKLSDDEVEVVDRMIRQAFERMHEWRQFTMRFHVNILDVALKHIEFSEADIRKAIDRASVFYGIQSPRLSENADTVAKIVIKDEPSECELSYNCKLLERSGLLTKDSLLLCFIHEMGHEYLYGHRFMLFDNELWMQELAVDMICGAYACFHFMTIAHYKLAISQLVATPTHPDGKMREDAFLFGFEVARDKITTPLTADKVLVFFKDFAYSRLLKLDSDWKAVKRKGLDYYLAHPSEMRKTTTDDISYMSTLDRVIKAKDSRQ